MRRSFILAILLTAPVIGNSQNFTLPTLYLDSLLFEATKYRGCDSVRVSQADELVKQGRELMETGNALKLSQSESKTLTGLLSNSKEQGRVDKMQYDLDKKVLKDKVKKRSLLIIGETILIVILLI